MSDKSNMSNYDSIRLMFEQKEQINKFNDEIKKYCEVIMRQTDYDEDTAMTKLKEHDLNVSNIIREYMGININKTNDVNKSTNQMIYNEFRKFLDEASNKYYKQREIEEQKQRFIQKLNEQKIK